MVFSSVLGQPKAVALLTRALARDRLAHGYLFRGPAGTGRRTTARALAAALFCRRDGTQHQVENRLSSRSGNGQPAQGQPPCGHCSGCRHFASGNHPDFFHIVPQGAFIRIDQIRALKKALTFSPLEAPLRVILLEDLQAMRREAANSLLKILEEPPRDNLFLLIGLENEPTLATITSRCQVIPFYPLPVDLAATIIQRLHPDLDQEQAKLLAHLVNGCPGQVAGGEFVRMLDWRDRILTCLLSLPQNQGQAVETILALARDLQELKKEIQTVVDLLRLFFWDVLRMAQGGSDRLAGREREAAWCKKALQHWRLSQISDKMDTLDRADRALRRNCNPALVCEVMLFELASR